MSDQNNLPAIPEEVATEEVAVETVAPSPQVAQQSGAEEAPPTLPPSMHVILTAQQMRQAEQVAVQAGSPLIVLMERAGLAVAEQIMARYTKRPTIVLCGPGNNGGDGFVAARHLSSKGWPVRILLFGKLEELTAEAKTAASRWRGTVITASLGTVQSALEKGAQLVVDGLYGIGLRRPVTGEAASILQLINKSNVPVVAIDIPSGLNADTGQVFGQAIAAEMTVCFFRKKMAHALMPGRMLSGDVMVVDIGIPEQALENMTLQVAENHPDLWSGYFPRPQLNLNKYDRGHVLVLGGPELTGAARLAALAAQRIGAGLVTIAAPQSAFMIYAAALTSIMVRMLGEGPGFIDSFQSLLKDRRYNVALIGPGAGVEEETRKAVLMALDAGKNAVLDADALNVFSGEVERLQEALAPMHHNCVLTPHEGEFVRLFTSKAVDPTKDKISRTRQAAAYMASPVLFKGADSVICSPEGLAIINTNAPATLATAGTGDVLAGFIAGLMAQGVDAFIATCMATWLHGAVAQEAGPCLIAEDLINGLPNVLRPKPVVTTN
jgi:NAD(P)H-hydrate epimerase